MRKLHIVATSLVLAPAAAMAAQTGDADCPIYATVMNPIALEQTQMADFGKIPSDQSTQHLLLDSDGTVWKASSILAALSGNYQSQVASVDSKAGQFSYSGTEGYKAHIEGRPFTTAQCTSGAVHDLALVWRDRMEGENYRGYWTYDKAEGIFDVAVTMSIDAGFVGLIDCDYELSAYYK